MICRNSGIWDNGFCFGVFKISVLGIYFWIWDIAKSPPKKPLFAVVFGINKILARLVHMSLKYCVRIKDSIWLLSATCYP